MGQKTLTLSPLMHQKKVRQLQDKVVLNGTSYFVWAQVPLDPPFRSKRAVLVLKNWKKYGKRVFCLQLIDPPRFHKDENLEYQKVWRTHGKELLGQIKRLFWDLGEYAGLLPIFARKGKNMQARLLEISWLGEPIYPVPG